MQAGHLARKPVIIDARCHPHGRSGPAEMCAGGDREMVRGLRIEPEQQRTEQRRIDRHFSSRASERDERTSFILKPRCACYIGQSGIIERLIWPRQSEF
jgi:hypothetical protein